MKHLGLIFFSVLAALSVHAQYENYMQVYPITEDPNVRWMSSYSPYETIMLEANPLVKFSLYNNFVKRMADTTKLHSMAQYFDFSPQLRIYTDTSYPVKTPSYRIELGTQHMFRLNSHRPHVAQFIGFALRSGHYSNGQAKCSFSEKVEDGTEACDSVYRTIDNNTDLSAILNRKNGNFSTNLTQLTISYRYSKLNGASLAKRTHVFSAGYSFYHDRLLGIFKIGGYSDADIKIFGKHRVYAGYEYSMTFSISKKRVIYQRFRWKHQLEVIIDAHPNVFPVRLESSVMYYPFQILRSFGIMVSHIIGHDNYNYRFVDAGQQFTVGITWDLFPPIKLSNG